MFGTVHLQLCCVRLTCSGSKSDTVLPQVTIPVVLATPCWQHIVHGMCYLLPSRLAVAVTVQSKTIMGQHWGVWETTFGVASPGTSPVSTWLPSGPTGSVMVRGKPVRGEPIRMMASLSCSAQNGANHDGCGMCLLPTTAVPTVAAISHPHAVWLAGSSAAYCFCCYCCIKRPCLHQTCIEAVDSPSRLIHTEHARRFGFCMLRKLSWTDFFKSDRCHTHHTNGVAEPAALVEATQKHCFLTHVGYHTSVNTACRPLLQPYCLAMHIQVKSVLAANVTFSK